MKHALFIVAFAVGLVSACHAQGQRTFFKEITAQEETDPRGAFVAMMTMAEDGYAPAIDRIGYYFRNGIGTGIDLETAGQWYTRALDAGHPWSAASAARVAIKLGQGDVAYALLQTGVSENRPGTHRLLATAHIDRQLGAASAPELGREMLERRVAAGDKNAARDLAVRINWGRMPGQISDAAVTLIVDAGLAGEARFAEVALVYLARQPDKRAAALQTRAALAEVPGIRDRVVSVERIRLAADRHPTQFWSKVEAVLADTDPENYARTASTAFWINKNAWVRVLQQELAKLSYYHGRINGLMTAQTIRAQNRFCRDAGIWTTCATGPLRGPTVRAVADAIASRDQST